MISPSTVQHYVIESVEAQIDYALRTGKGRIAISNVEHDVFLTQLEMKYEDAGWNIELIAHSKDMYIYEFTPAQKEQMI